jgi:catechol 2,3-dioxygenase-like lactoylglutathione lyase family enzyme
MSVNEVRVVSVPVSDQQRAKQFYVDTLGMELVRDESEPGRSWVQVKPSHCAVSLTLVTWFESMPPGSLHGLVLGSDDLQADYKRLTARGVTFDSPPQVRPWATEAVMRDPDGNMLVLQQA